VRINAKSRRGGSPEGFRRVGLLYKSPPEWIGLRFIKSSEENQEAGVDHAASLSALDSILRPSAPQRRSPLKSQGEIEAAVCDGITRFEQEFMGRGPKHIHTHLIGDLLLVRLQGVLTAAEQHLVQTLPHDKGRDLLKQVRTQLIETARPVLEDLIEEITAIKVLSLHQDISTVTGEEIVLFTLATAPLFRETGKAARRT
jgi:uncharacterized protein YbcI